MGACACKRDSKEQERNLYPNFEGTFKGVKIGVHKKELVTEEVDAIVNGSANENLIHN